jgi:hypothetical protein
MENYPHKPHISYVSGKWRVRGRSQGFACGSDWDSLREACIFALNIVSWERYNGSGMWAGSPLHGQWLELQERKF